NQLPVVSSKLETGYWELETENLPAAPGSAPRSPVILFAANPRGAALPFVQPHLHADRAVGGERPREAVVDVGAERLQRQLAVQVPLRARDFRAVQPARHPHLDAPGTEAQRRFD